MNLVYQESSDVFVEGEMKMHMYSEMNFSECSENAFSGVSLCSEQLISNSVKGDILHLLANVGVSCYLFIRVH